MATDSTPALSFVERLTNSYRLVTRILLGLGGVALIAALLLFRHSSQVEPPLDGKSTGYLYFGVFFTLLFLVWSVVGLWLMARPSDGAVRERSMLLGVLAVGTLTGLVIAFSAIMFQLRYLNYLTDWLNNGKKDHAVEVILMAFAAAFGLVIGFITVQLARTQERVDPSLRRLMYGYNVFVNSSLVLMLLIIVNVLLYFKLPARLDTTQTGFYSMSNVTKDFIATIDQPITAYLIMFDDDSPLQVYESMRSLLSNAEAINPRFRTEYVSPGLGGSRIRELRDKYPQVRDQQGLLLVYGDKDGNSSFIPESEMVGLENPNAQFNPREQPRYNFQGEGKLLSELRFLADGKSKPTIYFTTGHGELSITENDRAEGGVETARRLVDYLKKRNIEVKSLALNPLGTTPTIVPDDATIVVIAGPQVKFGNNAIETFRQYLNRPNKGKLFCLLDAVRTSADNNKVLQTGLEPLLADFNLQVEPRLLMMLDQSGVDKRAIGLVNEQLIDTDNRIASTFVGRSFDLPYCRPIELISSDRRNPAFKADELLRTPRNVIAWQSTIDPDKFDYEQFQKDAENPQKAAEMRLPSRLVSVAALVSETSRPQPDRAPTPDKPLLAVYGSSFRFRDSISARRPDDTKYFELFAATVDWLRERPSSIFVEPKQYSFYSFSGELSGFRLLFAPGWFFIVLILSLGVGVWLVRRR